MMTLFVFKPVDMTCETNGCRRGGPHLVETLSGIMLRLCPGCYDRWWLMFGSRRPSLMDRLVFPNSTRHHAEFELLGTAHA